MIEPASDVLSAAFNETELVLANGGAFSIILKNHRSRPDLSLIIDIYDLKNPIHPEGHIGWWRYDPEEITDRAVGRLSCDDGTNLPSPSIEGVTPTEEWQNKSPVDTHLFELQIVLRSTITHAILSIDRIPVVRSDQGLIALRSGFDRNYDSPSYAAFHRVFPSATTVHIVSRNIFQRDAGGNLCLNLYRMLKQHRVSVTMFAESFDFSMNDIIYRRSNLSRYVKKDDIIFYCVSTYDEQLAELVELPCRKIGYFHGITDPKLSQVFDPEFSMSCLKARLQLPLLARFDQLAANSHFSAARLREMITDQGAALNRHILILAPKIIGKPRQASAAVQNSDGASPSLLYVGHIRAHKRIEDIISLLHAYRKLEPLARCVFAGPSDCQAYQDYLYWFQTRRLGLPQDAISWLGSVSDEKLTETYDNASAYISMSENEGFCLPLLEAMERRLLVFAYDQPAVRETLGSAGVLFREKTFEYLANQLHFLLTNPEGRERVLDGQQARASKLLANMDGREYLDLLTAI